MPAQSRHVRWLDRVAVATVPVEIDISNADKVRDDLLSVVKQGPAAMVVDMGGTTFCDSAGVNALVRVYQQALAAGAPLRLVITASAVQRVLTMTGVDRLISTFPTVDAALADQAVAAARQDSAKADTSPGESSPGESSPGEGTARPQPGPEAAGQQTTLGAAQDPMPEGSLD
jgi:anti-sigma B factor antagonist